MISCHQSSVWSRTLSFFQWGSKLFKVTSEGRCVSSRGSCLNLGHANSIADVASRAFCLRQCSGQEQSEVQFTPHQHIFTQMVHADCRGHDLHDLRETARSPTTVTPCQLPQQSIETQRRTMEGRWVAAQKPPQQHLAGETSLLGTSRSPTAVVRAPVTSRGQTSFEVNRLTQISRSSSCRRERFCQGGNNLPPHVF